MTVREVPDASSAGTAASSDFSRRANLSLILSLVHHGGMLSRAELTRITGLNRSTVSALVGELVELRLVRESAATATNQIGRPSSNVHPEETTVAFAVTPEVDAITVGVVGLGGGVLRRVRAATGRIPSAEEAVGTTAGLVATLRGELGSEYRIAGIGVAVPGTTRTDDGLVRYAPQLGWRDAPIGTLLEDATGLPVSAGNDASLGARAEFLFGAGRDCLDLVYLNGGASGVGGGIIAGGIVRTGLDGYAGEFGHTLVKTDGVLCHCGSHGCLETEISLDRLQRLVGLSGADIDTAAAALLSQPSPELTAEVDRQIDYLAVTLRNAVNLFNPERVILGGFLSTLLSLAPQRLLDAVTGGAMHGPAEVVKIVPAVLGSGILLTGAAELAFSALLADPRAVAAEMPLGSG